MRSCFISGAGDFAPERFSPKPGDYIIAADAGLKNLEALNIAPDLIIGDFDSLGSVPEGPNVEVHPVEKDDTDMFLAVRRAMELRPAALFIFGGTGGARMDHTIANIQSLAYAAAHGARAYMFGKGFALAALHCGSLSFDEKYEGTLSVFCHGSRAEGVSETGVKYPLDSASLSCEVPVGVSNSFAGKARVSVKKGTLIVYWQDNPALPLPEFETGAT